jgi:hypothetical protein
MGYLLVACGRFLCYSFAKTRMRATGSLLMASRDVQRRWFGASCLLAALAMLVAGETVLRGRLDGYAFLLFWLACFAFTGMAIVVAFLDVSALRRRTRNEQRELVESTLKEIEQSKRLKECPPPDEDPQRPR